MKVMEFAPLKKWCKDGVKDKNYYHSPDLSFMSNGFWVVHLDALGLKDGQKEQLHFELKRAALKEYERENLAESFAKLAEDKHLPLADSNLRFKTAESRTGKEVLLVALLSTDKEVNDVVFMNHQYFILFSDYLITGERGNPNTVLLATSPSLSRFPVAVAPSIAEDGRIITAFKTQVGEVVSRLRLNGIPSDEEDEDEKDEEEVDAIIASNKKKKKRG